MHLAAESHVDRSIDGPGAFITTNINGTYVMLQEALRYCARSAAPRRTLSASTPHLHRRGVRKPRGRGPVSARTRRISPIRPIPPPRQRQTIWCGPAPHLRPADGDVELLEQLRAVPFPREADPAHHPQRARRPEAARLRHGQNIRDWLYVEDHAEALALIAATGTPGESYNVGGLNERRNIDVVRTICAILDEIRPDAKIGPRENLITFVTDRPGMMRAICHRCHQAHHRARLEGARDLRDGPAQDGALVSRQPRLVGAAAQTAMPASVWGSPPDARSSCSALTVSIGRELTALRPSGALRSRRSTAPPPTSPIRWRWQRRWRPTSRTWW